MVTKRKFEFPYYEGLVDIYLDGKKVHAKHPGKHGHIYFRISEDEKPKVEAAPHDSRIGIEAEIKDGKVVPLVIERKMFGAKDHTLPVKPLHVDKAVKRGDVPFKKVEQKVGFSQEATVEVTKKFKIPEEVLDVAVEPKSIEDYAKK